MEKNDVPSNYLKVYVCCVYNKKVREMQHASHIEGPSKSDYLEALKRAQSLQYNDFKEVLEKK